MVWDNGLHQFLQIKHLLRMEATTVFSPSISNLGLFKRYGNRIYGLTGTLGGSSSQAFLKYVYPVDLAFIPTFHVKRFLERPGILVLNEGEWARVITETVLAEIAKKRAVLIICESINAVDTIESALLKAHNQPSKIKRYSRNDNDESSIVAKTAEEGDIIIATNLAGRGTDIKTSEEVEQNGGLHVCLTFLATNKRVEDQAFGRTSREGHSGTAQLILDKKNTELNLELRHGCRKEIKSIEYIKAYRDEIELLELEEQQKFGIEKTNLTDRLVSEFCKLRRSLIEPGKPIYKLDEAEDRFSFWMKKWFDTIDKTHRINTMEVLNDYFAFRQAIEKNYENLEIHNPTRLILHANDAFRDLLLGFELDDGEDVLSHQANELKKNRGAHKDLAFSAFSKAIEIDPVLSIQAYYNRAFTRIAGSIGNYKEDALNDLAIAKLTLEEQVIPELQASQLIANLNPEQTNSQSPLVRKIQGKIELYRLQIQSIERAMETIRGSNSNSRLNVHLSYQLYDTFNALNFTSREVCELFYTGLREFYAIEVINKKKHSFFGALCVAFLGVLQILAGVLISMLPGIGTWIGRELIRQGINDLMVAAMAAMEGDFDWKAYQANKTVSLAVSIVCMGIDLIKANLPTKAGEAAPEELSNKADKANKAIMDQAFFERAKQQVGEAIVVVGINKAIHIGIDTISRSMLDNFESEIKNSVQDTLLKQLEQENVILDVNKLLALDASGGSLCYAHSLKKIVYESLLANQKLKDFSSQVLRGVLARQNSTLSNLIKLVDIVGAVDEIIHLTQQICFDFIQEVHELSESLTMPTTVNQDLVVKSRSQLYADLIDMITQGIMSSLHGQVIHPATDYFLNDKVNALASSIQKTSKNISLGFVSEKEEKPETVHPEQNNSISQENNEVQVSILPVARSPEPVMPTQGISSISDGSFDFMVMSNALTRSSLLIPELKPMGLDNPIFSQGGQPSSSDSWIDRSIDYMSDIWDEWQLSERGLGLMQCVAGVSQVGISVVGGVLTAESGIGPIMAAGYATLGMDNAVAGCQIVWTGEPQPTLLNTALHEFGFNESQSNAIEMGVNLTPVTVDRVVKTTTQALDQIGFFSSKVKTQMGLRNGNILSKPTLFHAKTNLEVTEHVFKEGISPIRLNPNNRFGKAFYTAENGYTTISELAHHGAKARYAIHYHLEAPLTKILDLTQPKIAKQWGYLGGNNYKSSQEIAVKAREAGYNAIRFMSERGRGRSAGANIAILKDFNEILKPQKIIKVPEKQPARFSNPFK
jgi:hypothetical protein